MPGLLINPRAHLRNAPRLVDLRGFPDRRSIIFDLPADPISATAARIAGNQPPISWPIIEQHANTRDLATLLSLLERLTPDQRIVGVLRNPL